MKKIAIKIALFIVVVLPSAFYAQSPNWQWAKIGGSSGQDAGKDIVIDTQGNIYVLGVFRDFDITIEGVTLINAGDDDIFLAKYNPNGGLIWVKSINGQATDFAVKLLIDKNNDVYVSGGFSSPTLTIGTTTLTNSGSYSFFTAKYNSSGQVIWAKNNLNSNLNASIIAIDDNLNSYSIIATASVATLEKRNVSESLIWSKTITTTGSISSPQVHYVFVNETGVYLTGGFFGSSLTIGTSTILNSASANSDDMFVAKLDTSGNVLWLKNGLNTSGDNGTVVQVDNNGNVYVLGMFSTGITFDSFTLTSNGDYDLFLVKYNSSGQVIWAKNAGGIFEDWVVDLAIDASGGTYVIGGFDSPSFTFANTTYNNLGVWFSYADVFVLKYDAQGNEAWIKNIEGLGNDNGNGIAVNSLGEVYVTGAIEDTLGGITNLGNFQLIGAGLDDFFFAKLASTVGLNEEYHSDQLIIYPNPNTGIFNIEIADKDGNSLMGVYDIMGKKLVSKVMATNKMEIDISMQPKGMYLIKVISGDNVLTQKIVVQ